ncbi:hypothetical protein [Leifsonia sp. NPDC058230]
MNEAREYPPEYGDPLDIDPEDDAMGESGPGPYDADGFVEPKRDGDDPD